MPRHAVPYRTTGRFSPIAVDYVEGRPELREFFAYIPDRTGLAAAMAERGYDPAMRATLSAVLQDQYKGLAVDQAVSANLDALRQEGTLTVTTGHQLCLFTGPLYVPFKILNTIRLARGLSTPERPVVPVFWMATEDHDRAEIDHTWIGGKKVQWPGEASGAVGRLDLDGIEAAVAEAESLLGPGPHADELRALLRSCYREEHTLAQATRLFVNALFGRFGLVILDADDARLKRAFAPIMQEELLNQVTERTVRYANEKLRTHYEPQAHARDINLFHLSSGHRSRIGLEGDNYRVLAFGLENAAKGMTWQQLKTLVLFRFESDEMYNAVVAIFNDLRLPESLEPFNLRDAVYDLIHHGDGVNRWSTNVFGYEDTSVTDDMVAVEGDTPDQAAAYAKVAPSGYPVVAR